MSFYINLELIIGQQQVSRLKRSRIIDVVPVAYLRGVTFTNCIVILDEAQNASKSQIKMFLTRLGDECKFVIAGDLEQSDLDKESGLEDALNRFNGIKGVGSVEFSIKDIVRHPLVAEIVRRYDE
jgi:phosphate starvation-inducible PhoH-like protein